MARPLRLSLLAGVVALLPLAAPAMALGDQEYRLFVWRVTPAGAPADVHADYLIGTLHLPVGQGLVMPAPVKTLINASSVVVTEANTDDVGPELVAKFMFLKGPKTLKQLMPAASWPKLVKAARPMGLSPEHLVRMEPWFLNVGLTLPTPDGNPVIDELIKAEAEKARIDVAYLEGAEEQLKMMDSVRQEEDVRQLVETLEHPQQAKQLLAELRKSYFAGDQPKLEKLVFDPAQLRAYPDFYKKMIFDRNARWMPKVTQLFQDEDAVVAVGLGHLLGDKGLVRQLKAKGYKVEPLAL